MQPELLVGPGGQMELENVPDYILSALVEDVAAISTTEVAVQAEPTNGFLTPPVAGVDAPALTLVPMEQGRLAMVDPQPDDVITKPEDISTSAGDVDSTTEPIIASTSSDIVQPTATPTVMFSTEVPALVTPSETVSESTSETAVLDTASATPLVSTVESTSVVTATEVDTSLLSTSTAVDSVSESNASSTTTATTITTSTQAKTSTSTHSSKKHTAVDSESLVTTHYISRTSGATRIFGPGGTTVTASSESSSPTVKLNAATPQQKATQRTVRTVLIVLAVAFTIFLFFFLLRKRICRPCCSSDEEDDVWVAPPMSHTHVSGTSQMGLDAAVDKHRESIIHVQQLASCTPQLTSIPRVNYERHGGASQRVHLPPVPAPENPFEQPAHRFSPGFARPTSVRLTPTDYSPSHMPRFREPQASPAPAAPRKLYGLGYTNIGLGVGEVWQGRYAARDY
ncbi:hypothetical protein AURDEDRAFT_114935 [Auricularia subglabra TFB-10046 SS5]|nr:hypothetical protein AURDEDRAFT_114935 [Auricularia subglabra TFB-10046 SS5]